MRRRGLRSLRGDRSWRAPMKITAVDTIQLAAVSQPRVGGDPYGRRPGRPGRDVQERRCGGRATSTRSRRPISSARTRCRSSGTTRSCCQPICGFSSTGAEIRAASALDIALWDLFGKRYGMPVWQALGGRSHDRVRVYNTCASNDYNAYATWRRELAGDERAHAARPLRRPHRMEPSRRRARARTCSPKATRR